MEMLAEVWAWFKRQSPFLVTFWRAQGLPCCLAADVRETTGGVQGCHLEISSAVGCLSLCQVQDQTPARTILLSGMGAELWSFML